MVDCFHNSGKTKGIGFYRIPVVVTNQGEKAEELSIERRERWIAAISRDGLRRFRYLSSSLLSSSLHVPYRITEFATYHNRVRYLYLDAKFKTCSREVVGAITWHNSV